MMRVDKTWMIGDVTVFGDDEKFNVFYLLPRRPRYLVNADGSLAFKFLKYRFPINHPDGSQGGGFAMFDVELVVDESLMPGIMQELTSRVNQEATARNLDEIPPVVIGSLIYVSGEAAITVMGNEEMVGPITNPGSPSLYGNNVCSFAVELSQTGATLFEQAMQGAGGGVNVSYDLTLMAKLPDVEAECRFRARAFYSFYQSIDVDWSFWGEDDYQETVREQMRSSESLEYNFNLGLLEDEEAQAIRNSIMNTFEASVERRMIDAIAPLTEDQREVPDGIEDVTRNISQTQISDVYVKYNEKKTVDWPVVPQGMIANITEMKDPEGNNYVWDDYMKVVDLDDDFFKTLMVNVFINANFTDLPIHSVEVLLEYNGAPMPNRDPNKPRGEVNLNSPDSIGQFETYVENDNWNYVYSYQVNYEGETQIYQSPKIETNEGNLTINVDGLGILDVMVSAGDINWSDVETALVEFRYEDQSAGVAPIEDQFQLSESQTSHRIQHVIFAPMRKNYTYRVKYFMKDGKEFQGELLTSRSERLFINDTFGGHKSVAVRSLGDYANHINTVFVNLEYVDDENQYSQKINRALSASQTFFDWSFPVINENSGRIFYDAVISYKDSTSETIERTELESDTLILPPAIESFLEVDVVTSLIDWNEVKLSHVSLRYDDPSQSISESQDFFLSATNGDSQSWRVEQKNEDHDEYTYKVVYYFANGGGQKTVGPETTEDTALILNPIA